MTPLLFREFSSIETLFDKIQKKFPVKKYRKNVKFLNFAKSKTLINYKILSMYNKNSKITPIVKKGNIKLQKCLDTFRKIVSYLLMFESSIHYVCNKL